MRALVEWTDGYEVDELGGVWDADGNRVEVKHTNEADLVCLRRPGNRYTSRRVARLVAEAFVPNPEGRKVVIHIDGDRTNNAAVNLRWVSPGEAEAIRTHGRGLCSDHGWRKNV